MYLTAMRIILFAAILCVGVAAQGQQFFRQNSGTSETLFTISMMDDTRGIAAGGHQVVAITTNSGAGWASSQIFGQENYYCSYYNDTSSGAIGGSHGLLLCKRPRRGFAQISLPERKDVHGITFPTSEDLGNPRDLLCVGDSGLIYHSGDSGKNWAKVAPPALAANRNFYGTTYWDDSTWWIVGAGGVILYTEDAGTNWQRIPAGTQRDLYSICFPTDGTTGWIVGDSTILYTTDLGDSWQPIPTTARLRHVDGYDTIGAAVGLDGAFMATSDFFTWFPLSPGTTANLYGIGLTALVSDISDDIYITGDSGIILTSFASTESVVAKAVEEKYD